MVAITQFYNSINWTPRPFPVLQTRPICVGNNMIFQNTGTVLIYSDRCVIILTILAIEWILYRGIKPTEEARFQLSRFRFLIYVF